MDEEGENEAGFFGGVAVEDKEEEKKLIPTYPLIRFSDMPEDMKPEIVDLVSGAVEKYSTDGFAACKSIKAEMDKTYGPHWHVAVGESFGFEVTHEKNQLLYIFVGTVGVVLWKCS